jgi:hypothetical protein
MRPHGFVTSSIASVVLVSSRPASAQQDPSMPPYALPYPTYAQPIAPAPRLRYEPGMPPPPGYHFERNARKGFLISGALTFGLPYTASAMIAMVSKNEDDIWLLVPVAGPIGSLAAGRAACDKPERRDCTAETLIAIGLGFDIAFQTIGAGLFTAGFLFPKKEWVSDYDVAARASPSFTWSIAPRVDAEGRVGLTFAGSMF